ncbi:phospholipase D-like domain-containing protein [Methylotenera sp. N17]|uniref:phospholipase D-like domain-containing protein n=1 Tax=Methylotenera sp. N17 TaxID=1502761 RepID=UPI000648F98D|nr:phospholipase D family protein [Methylotenera sp. N17]
MKGLYTNQTALGDYIKNGILDYSNVPNVYIAVAFFTEANVVEEIATNGCHIRIIVRLGFPTSPYALKKLFTNKNIEIRFFSNQSFHPKLYIFGDQIALVGSANLTSAAIHSNQEIIVTINPDDERFTELAILFTAYWNQASVLTEEAIREYEKIYNKSLKAAKEIEDGNDEVIKKFGDVVFSNINRGVKHQSKENIFIESYRKTYQESVTAFHQIEKVYQEIGKRKLDEDVIPLRLEIDSFFSFVRDRHATHEKWREVPIGWNEERKDLLKQLIEEWLTVKWSHFELTIAEKNYPLIKKVFASPESINSSTMEDIIDGLVVLHSFYDRLRFFDGGLETLKKTFAKQNNLQTVRSSLSHLIFGKGDIVKRMSDLIYDPAFKLNEFGQSNVQELVGWVNNVNLPVINGRTTKILRYLGFNIRQL